MNNQKNKFRPLKPIEKITNDSSILPVAQFNSIYIGAASKLYAKFMNESHQAFITKHPQAKGHENTQAYKEFVKLNTTKNEK